MLKLSTDMHSKLVAVFRGMKNRLNVFYILALIPLLLVAYYDIHYLSPLMFGFLLLLLRKDKLSTYGGAGSTPRSVGVILALGSLVVYYALVLIFSFIPLYEGAINYAAYIFGLFLAFFDLSALKEAFTPIFIIAAAISIAFVNLWLEINLSSNIIPFFTLLIAFVAKGLGLGVTVQYPDLITLQALRGQIQLQIIWGCIGAYGALVFSILMVIVFSEEPVGRKTKIIWTIIGIIGVLVLNVLRVIIILTIAYFYDFNVAELAIHPYLGYTLFLIWLILFLYIFSNRESFLKRAMLKSRTT